MDDHLYQLDSAALQSMANTGRCHSSGIGLEATSSVFQQRATCIATTPFHMCLCGNDRDCCA